MASLKADAPTEVSTSSSPAFDQPPHFGPRLRPHRRDIEVRKRIVLDHDRASSQRPLQPQPPSAGDRADPRFVPPEVARRVEVMHRQIGRLACCQQK